jgi:proline racemase/trans-L-3-hydroxyproline dehydratase
MMKIERIIETIDSHTGGEPTRVITGGLPYIHGETMAEKLDYFKSKLDFIRTAIVHEPRGHKEMIVAALIPPACKEADFGTLYMNSAGYLNMCVHGSIGIGTTLVKMGWVTPVEPVSNIRLDTAAGLVNVNVHVENGCVTCTGVVNVPSFLFAENVKISVPSIPAICVDIAYGGNFFILVNAEDLGLSIASKNIPDFIRIADLIADNVNRGIQVIYPGQQITNVKIVHFYGPPSNSQSDSKTLNVGTARNIDRSPCGTGTSARMGALYAKGKLGLGDTFCTESVIGSLFKGRVLEEKKVGPYHAIVPEIIGSAYITGIHQFLIEHDDPLKHGFVV